MIILGIDPGSLVCGYGVIEQKNENLKLIEFGVINAKLKESEFNKRLVEIHKDLLRIIERTKPDVAVFENTFFSKNVQSLVKLTHARASAILSAALSNIPIFEYSPREIKKSVTGRGNASKEQVRFMVNSILEIQEQSSYFDASDALAIAVCHSSKYKLIEAGISKSWNDFIKNNPDKIIG